MDIAAWLRELGLDQYERAFLDNAIDANVLPTLTAEDLKDIGVTAVGHRRKLLNAIAPLREPKTIRRRRAHFSAGAQLWPAGRGRDAASRPCCSAILSDSTDFPRVSIPRTCAT